MKENLIYIYFLYIIYIIYKYLKYFDTIFSSIASLCFLFTYRIHIYHFVSLHLLVFYNTISITNIFIILY